MALQRYKTLIIVLVAVLVLVIASPLLQQAIVLPQTQLTEMWLLGPNHDSTYPTNVTSGQNIHLYLDVDNHLGSSASYTAEVKFRNATQSAPNSFNQTNSKLSALDSFTFSVADNQTHELPIDVSFNYTISEGATRQLKMQSITINSKTIPIDSTTITYDSDKGGFYGNLFFELYLYNSTTDTLVYHQRYVSLWVQMLP